jgi:serine/threonine-protein kinase
MSTGSGTLGKYQIIREIARSNDIVYEAYDPAMNRRVALKELNMPTGIGEKQIQERRSRFSREAKAAGSLSHPNIVTIFEVGEDNGRPYIAMEYLEGHNLRQRLDIEGKLEAKEAVDIAVQVLAGLQYAHDHGVIHRDVKPENIQLLPDGRVKLTDFGIARLTFEPTLTIDGQIFGTPSYMSPEQVVGKEIDARTDVFSTGIILFEALTGSKPFTGDNVVSISHAITHLQPPDPQGVPYGVVQIMRKALDKQAANRHHSAKDMAVALKSEMTQPEPPQAAQPSVYQPNPYGPPPMGAPYGPPPPPTPTPTGQPYNPPPPGSPYGQPYGGGPPVQYQQVMLPPFPPGWAAPPPPKPLLPSAVSTFIWRTFWVIVIGGVIAALGFVGIARLSDMTLAKERAKEAMVLTQATVDRAVAYRNEAMGQFDAYRRFELLGFALDSFQEASQTAPTPENAAVIAIEASQTAMMMGREAANLRDARTADYYSQLAIQHADASGDQAAMENARRFREELFGG